MRACTSARLTKAVQKSSSSSPAEPPRLAAVERSSRVLPSRPSYCLTTSLGRVAPCAKPPQVSGFRI